MEKKLKIKTPDKHVVYGTLRTPKRDIGTLLIFVHGLTGHQNEHIFYNGARFFADCGIATFRFDLYSGEKGGRTLSNCSISKHAEDLNTVMKYFRKKFRKVFVAGHSLGGIVILLSDSRLADGIILWDSSCRANNLAKRVFKYDERIKKYVICWGIEHLMGRKMYEEWVNFPAPRISIRRIEKPVKVIVAGKGMLQKAGLEYYRFAKHPGGFVVIKGAGHNFNEDGSTKKLFLETLKFIKISTF